MDKSILITLADCLVRTMDANGFAKHSSDASAPERIQRMTLAAIFDFICDSGKISRRNILSFYNGIHTLAL